MLQKIRKAFENSKGAVLGASMLAAGTVAGATSAQADYFEGDLSHITSIEEMESEAKDMSELGTVAILVQSDNPGVLEGVKGAAITLVTLADKKGGNIDIAVLEGRNLREGSQDRLEYYINGISVSTAFIDGFSDPQGFASEVIDNTLGAIRHYKKEKKAFEQAKADMDTSAPEQPEVN